MGCLIIFKSITYAQRASQILAAKGIASTMIKPPVSLGKSCSYALKLRQEELAGAAALLRRSNIPLNGTFVLEEGYYREVQV